MRPILSIASTTVGEAIRRKVLLIILLIGLVFLFVAPGARRALDALRVDGPQVGFMLFIDPAHRRGHRGRADRVHDPERGGETDDLHDPLEASSALAVPRGQVPRARWRRWGLMMGMMSIVLVGVFVLQQGDERRLGGRPIFFKGPMHVLRADEPARGARDLLLDVRLPRSSTSSSRGVSTCLERSSARSSRRFRKTRRLRRSRSSFATVINSILPNFASYNIQNPIINPGQAIQNESVYYMQTIGYGLAYIVGLLIAGIVIFDRKRGVAMTQVPPQNPTDPGSRRVRDPGPSPGRHSHRRAAHAQPV